MHHVIYSYLIVTLVANLIWWIAVIDVSGKIGVCFCNPKWIYDHTKTNWFGTVFLTILANVALGPSAICYWFYKLCTIGRRD